MDEDRHLDPTDMAVKSLVAKGILVPVKPREKLEREIAALRRRERAYRWMAILLSVVLFALLVSLPLLFGGAS
jgi:hypothetical protein